MSVCGITRGGVAHHHPKSRRPNSARTWPAAANLLTPKTSTPSLLKTAIMHTIAKSGVALHHSPKSGGPAPDHPTKPLAELFPSPFGTDHIECPHAPYMPRAEVLNSSAEDRTAWPGDRS
jgi:hypothetical protein